MQSVAVDDANPHAGEEAYILQVSIPSAPGVDGGDLMDKIGRFVELYLSAAQPGEARFAQMGGTTWVIAASTDAAFTLDQARADLAATLFGADDGRAVQLEWPNGVEPVDPNAVDETAADEEVDAKAEPGEVEAQSAYAPPDEEVPVFATDAESDFAAAGDTDFELDDDAWTLGDGADETPEADGDETDIFIGDDIDLDEIAAAAAAADEAAEASVTPALDPEAWSIEEASPTSADPAQNDDVFVIDDLNEGFTDDLSAIGSEADDFMRSDDVATPGMDVEAEAAYTLEVASAAQRAAFDDSTDVFEVDAFDIEIVDPETGVPTAEAELEPRPEIGPAAELTPDGLETLTEVPDRPETPDIAKELSAFRAEMREIASTIPGGGAGDLLAEFRAELDAISGAMGQRVDGAAQRIEAAASQVVEASARLDAARLNAAAARAEQSAQQLEAGVAEALSALNAARIAMSAQGGPATSDAAG